MPRLSPVLRSLYHNQRGHTLYVAEHQTGSIIICRACGAYSEGARVQGLENPCNPNAESGRLKANWSRAFRGKSPNYRKGNSIILSDLLPFSTIFELRHELEGQE